MSYAFAQESVTVLHRAAAFADLLQGLELADGREVVAAGVLQEPPCVLRGDRRIAERRQHFAARSGFELPGEKFAKGVDVLAAVGLDEPVGLGHAVELDDRCLEVVGHAGDALGADDVDIGVVGLGLGQLPVDMPLGDVEDHAVLERAVALEPPRVLVVPHAQGLCVPSLEFGPCVPARDVDVMHAAVVERGAFVFMPFARDETGRHVADAHDGQFADLTLCDEILDRIMIPRVAQIEVHGGEQGRAFGHFDGFPFVLYAVGDGFFGDDVLACGKSLFDLRFAGVGQGEESYDLNRGIVENELFVGEVYLIAFPRILIRTWLTLNSSTQNQE